MLGSKILVDSNWSVMKHSFRWYQQDLKMFSSHSRFALNSKNVAKRLLCVFIPRMYDYIIGT